jgi:hypothetical protein
LPFMLPSSRNFDCLPLSGDFQVPDVECHAFPFPKIPFSAYHAN